MLAIAAMSENRVIGNGNEIPWRIPDEFRWFRRMTLGSVVVMGRRTFESLPKPLEGRINVVLTRHPRRLLSSEAWRARFADAVAGSAAHSAPRVAQLDLPKLPRTEVRVARGIESLERAGVMDRAWLCGGAQVYEQFLGRCSDLYLSVVRRTVEGDAVFPPFEHLFDLAEVVAVHADFRVLHYVRNGASDARETPRGEGRPRARGGPTAARGRARRPAARRPAAAEAAAPDPPDPRDDQLLLIR
jgi:dihydrofolate reductase